MLKWRLFLTLIRKRTEMQFRFVWRFWGFCGLQQIVTIVTLNVWIWLLTTWGTANVMLLSYCTMTAVCIFANNWLFQQFIISANWQNWSISQPVEAKFHYAICGMYHGSLEMKCPVSGTKSLMLCCTLKYPEPRVLQKSKLLKQSCNFCFSIYNYLSLVQLSGLSDANIKILKCYVKVITLYCVRKC